MSDAVLSRRIGDVLILTLNEPETRNALSDEIVEALDTTLTAAHADYSIGCVVITGEGDCFSSGGNIKHMKDRSHPMFAGSPAEMQDAYRASIQRLPRLMSRIDVPVIAAVNGPAIGAGCDLAAMCDIRLAVPEAFFTQSFLRLGLISGDGGAWYLTRVIGLSRSLEMALTCDRVDAANAEKIGLVSRVVPRETLLDEAVALAERISAFPRRSARLTKRLFRESAANSLGPSLDLAAAYQSILQHTGDQQEAVTAFVDKRPAEYSGR